MVPEELENKLETLPIPNLDNVTHQSHIKLAILNARKSSKLSFYLFLIPLLILGSALLQSILKVSVPPWSLLQKYSPQLPQWMRIGIFTVVLIIIPAIIFFVNLLSILWIRYDKVQKIIHISIKLRMSNLIFLILSFLLAILFLGHTIVESIRE
jgi:hypothetical protein